MINFIENFENNDITLESKLNKSKPSTKSNIIMSSLLLFVIVISVVAAGSLGPEFFNFFIYLLFFGLPLMIMYKDSIISMIPSNISSKLVSNIQNQQDEPDEDEEKSKKEEKKLIDVTPKKNKELFVLAVGSISICISAYILWKRKDSFVGMATSLFFTILANIIVGDLF